MSIAKLARPEIQALHPYEAAEQVDNTVRLNANESPRSLAVGHFRRPLNRYPEVRPQQLGKTLAERFGCAPEQLLVTRGSSEAIDLIIRAFCAAGRDAVLVNSPSFSMYRHYAEVQGARLIEVPTLAERDFAVDVRDILDACDHDTRLIFICSPNNPTGTTLPREELETLLRERGDRSAIVVDEAYVEFGDKPSATELLADYNNVLVLRTLSKALAFAGARCGAVAGPAEVIRMLSAIQAPYALSTPVIECVEDALLSEQLEAAQEAVAEILAERTRLADALQAFPFISKIWPSDANFLLVRCEDARAVMATCAENGVLLRHFGGPLEDCIRITVGSREDNDTLLETLSRIGKGAHG